MIFVAENGDELSGFLQLYPSYCSVSAVPILILYDLFVDQSKRSKGIGRSLMNAARGFARENGWGLELYEQLHWPISL